MSLANAWKRRRTGGVAGAVEGADTAVAERWNVLVVDDDPDIIELTRVSLKSFRFEGRGLRLICAASGAEARERLTQERDLAVALIDVVMETDDAGLRLVEHIRNVRGDHFIRLIIRTGQPGSAPELEVINNYDIDDYKDKTELTAKKLYTTLRSALKSYRDLMVIERNRINVARNRDGLKMILEATPLLHRYEEASLSRYFEGVLKQVISLCDLGETSALSTLKGFIATFDGNNLDIQAGTGRFQDLSKGDPKWREIYDHCSALKAREWERAVWLGDAYVVPLEVHAKVIAFIYLEPDGPIDEESRALIELMARQCAIALENMRGHMEMRAATYQAMSMLEVVANCSGMSMDPELNGVAWLTEHLSLELGLEPREASRVAEAARLRDIGKLGVSGEILRKRGRLTREEFDEIKSHCDIGDSILGQSDYFALAREVAAGHHERWDGGGYPNGLKGEAIPLANRIVFLVDVFYALINVRPYRDRPHTVDEAVEEIHGCIGREFDPRVVEAFERIHRRGELADLPLSSKKSSVEQALNDIRRVLR